MLKWGWGIWSIPLDLFLRLRLTKCFKKSAVAEATVYPKKYAHGFCFAVLCYGYTLTDFPMSIRLTSLALWQSNDCPSASKATLMNMDKYFMWIHYERLHNHNKAKHNKTVCIFLGIYCSGFGELWHLLEWLNVIVLSLVVEMHSQIIINKFKPFSPSCVMPPEVNKGKQWFSDPLLRRQVNTTQH